MTRIKNIALSEWKGITRSEDIDPLTVFVGESGSGKSAYLSGLAFGVTGHAAGGLLGKKLEDTALLTSLHGGSVAVTLADGFAWSRGIERSSCNGDVKNSMTVRIAGQQRRIGAEAAHGMVQEQCGQSATLLTASEFLALSPDKQMAAVLDLSARIGGHGGTIDADNIMARVLVEFLADKATPEAVAALLAGKAHCLEHVKPLLAKLLSPDECAAAEELVAAVMPHITGEASEAIGAAIATAADYANATKREATAAQRAGEELAAQKATIKVAAGQVSELIAKRAALAVEEKGLLGCIGEADERVKHQTTLTEQIAAAERELAAARTELASRQAEPIQTADDIAALEQGRQAHKAEADSIKVAVGALQERADEITRQRNTLAKAGAVAQTGEQAKANAERDIAALMAEIVNLEAATADETRTAAEVEAEAATIEGQPKPSDEAVTQADAAQATAMNAEEATAIALTNARLATQQTTVALGLTRDAVESSPWLRLQDHVRVVVPGADALLVNQRAALFAIEGIVDDHAIADAQAAALLPGLEQEAKAAADALPVAQAGANSAKLARQAAAAALDAARTAHASVCETWAGRMVRVHHLRSLAEAIGQLSAKRGQLDAAKAKAEAPIPESSASIEVAIAKLDADLKAVRTDIIERERAAAAAMEDATESLRQIGETKAVIQQHKTRLAELARETETHEAGLKDLRWRLAKLGACESGEALRIRQAALADEIAKLDENIKTRRAYDVLEEQLSAASIKAQSRTVAHRTAKDVVKAIKVMREGLLASLTAPLTALMDKFLSPLGVRAYVDLDRFLIGWERDGLRIPLKTLSEGEGKMFVPALNYAFLMSDCPPLKVLPVEATGLSPRFMPALLRCCEAIKADVDNVLVTTHVRLPERETAGWRVIDCDEVPEEVPAAESATTDVPAAAGVASDRA